MGISHGLRYAAIVLEVDSLDVGYSFQVNFVNCGFRFVKDEAKPEIENTTLKSSLETWWCAGEKTKSQQNWETLSCWFRKRVQ